MLDIIYYDKIDFLIAEQEEKVFTCISKHLNEEHPEFVMTIPCNDYTKEDIEKLTLNERYIIKQGIKSNPEDIYRIYLKKINKLKPSESDKFEFDEFVRNIMTSEFNFIDY